MCIVGCFVGLVFSGGVVRVCVYLGVLEELEVVGVIVDCFVGISMGVIIVVLVVSGLDVVGVDV